jgi:hypothetical protein
MKTKVIILIAVSAVVTLSFTFVTVRDKQAPQAAKQESARTEESTPAGGFILEDRNTF